MPYTPTEWSTGDTITASALNKIENGIANAGSGSGAVIITDNGTALDKTYAEIYALIESGTPCYISYIGGKAEQDLDSYYAYSVTLLPVVAVYKYSDAYRIMAVTARQATVSNVNYLGASNMWTYSASNSSSYPTFLRQTYVSSTYLLTAASRDM